MESKTTIEVNGTRYDSTTGAVLGATSAPTLRKNGRNMDGFFRPRATITPTAKTPPPAHDSVSSLASKAPSAPELKSHHQGRGVNHTRAHTPQAAKVRAISVSHTVEHAQSLSVRRGPANHVHHHAVQHSRILRRDSVPAPSQSTHNLLKPKGVLQHAEPSLVELKKSADAIDAERLLRAQAADKSPMVARHATGSHNIVPTFSPVAVQPIPSTPSAAPTPMPGNGDVPGAPSPQPSNKPTGPTDMFEHALANANNFVDLHAHRAHYKKKVHTHVASMAFGSLALIVVAAFVAYVNNPTLQLKVASLKAGVSTSMPNFAAAGFSYNGVRAGDGKLTLGFKGQGGTYQLTQTDTNLSDTDMIQNVGATDASGTPTYSAVEADGVTVYRLNNTNATWVSGGKWYTVTGTNALSNDQVKSLVQHI